MVLLSKMKEAQEVFYRLAVDAGHHQFIEINGFATELIKICTCMLEDGIDFQENRLRLHSEQARYIGGKLECIFGPALHDVETLQCFLEGLYDLPVTIVATADQVEIQIRRVQPREASGDGEAQSNQSDT